MHWANERKVQTREDNSEHSGWDVESQGHWIADATNK